MPENISFEELCYWNMNSYGTALRLPRSVLRGLLIGLCMVTPGTNWMVPFVPKLFRQDIWVRWCR